MEKPSSSTRKSPRQHPEVPVPPSLQDGDETPSSDEEVHSTYENQTDDEDPKDHVVEIEEDDDEELQPPAKRQRANKTPAKASKSDALQGNSGKSGKKPAKTAPVKKVKGKKAAKDDSITPAVKIPASLEAGSTMLFAHVATELKCQEIAHLRCIAKALQPEIQLPEFSLSNEAQRLLAFHNPDAAPRLIKLVQNSGQAGEPAEDA